MLPSCLLIFEHVFAEKEFAVPASSGTQTWPPECSFDKVNVGFLNWSALASFAK